MVSRLQSITSLSESCSQFCTFELSEPFQCSFVSRHFVPEPSDEMALDATALEKDEARPFSRMNLLVFSTGGLLGA